MDTRNPQQDRDQNVNDPNQLEDKQGKKGSGNKGHNQYTQNENDMDIEDKQGKKGTGNNKGHNQYTK